MCGDHIEAAFNTRDIIRDFGATAVGLIIRLEQDDNTLMYRITKQGDATQRLGVIFAFVQVLLWDEHTASYRRTLYSIKL